MACKKVVLVAVLTIATFVASTESKTVLFIPTATTSYVVYHSQVAGALADLGHDVWLCIPHYMLEKNILKDKTVNVFEYGKQMGNIEARIYKLTRVVDRFWEGDTPEGLKPLYYSKKVFVDIATEILSDSTFIERVKTLKPDLIVVESIIFNLNMLVIPYMLDIPFALIGTIHDVVLAKVPFSPGLTPFPVERKSDRMSFFERFTTTLAYLARINFDLYYDSSLVSKFAPQKPYKSINDIASTAEIFIAEVDHIMDYPRVTLPNTKLIGGSSASPAKPLDGEFKTFVDKSKNGIIVFTFGGSVSNIPEVVISKLFSAFKQIDLDVIWKVNATSPDPSRIMTSKWIPQNDLLGHEKTRLFISHCGKNGQYEALFHGVPILCLPIYGDQGYNALRITEKGFGLMADMREVSSDEFATMIKEIVYKGNYTENMKKASRLYRELYKVPKKEAAYWLDHVLQYGGAYMRSPGQQMPWYQIYMLDVMAVLSVIIILIALMFYLITKQFYGLLFTRKLCQKSKKE